MNKYIKLKLTSKFRDGGSLLFEDEEGNEYWRDFGFGHTKRNSLLYKGHPNVERFSKPVTGVFRIEDDLGNIVFYEQNLDAISNKGKAVKKPIKINWFKWTGKLNKLSDWITSMGEKPTDIIDSDKNGGIMVKTLEGLSYKVPLNYIIIRGVEGEYYPCEPKIFDKTYDKIKEK